MTKDRAYNNLLTVCNVAVKNGMFDSMSPVAELHEIMEFLREHWEGKDEDLAGDQGYISYFNGQNEDE